MLFITGIFNIEFSENVLKIYLKDEKNEIYAIIFKEMY